MRKNYRSNVEEMMNDIQENPEGSLRLGISQYVFSKKKQISQKNEEKLEVEKKIIVSPIEIAADNENLEKNEEILQKPTEKNEEILEKSSEKNEEILEKYDEAGFDSVIRESP